MKMLVVSNCAAIPYERIFSCLLPKAEVSSLHVSKLAVDPLDLKLYDVILVHSSQVQKVSAGAAEGAQIIEIPHFHFSGYHPDMTYAVLSSDAHAQIQTPVGAYHSMLALAAFRSGMDVETALTLYRGETYDALGYFDEYEESKASLIETYSNASLDLSHLFRQWSRRGCFMHTFNHPRHYCFEDIAKLICNKRFGGHIDWPYELQDVLAQDMIFPCYPELAERRGTTGSYTFKVVAKYQLMSLEEFVAASFDVYRVHGVDGITASLPFRQKFNGVQDYVSGVL